MLPLYVMVREYLRYVREPEALNPDPCLVDVPFIRVISTLKYLILISHPPKVIIIAQFNYTSYCVYCL